ALHVLRAFPTRRSSDLAATQRRRRRNSRSSLNIMTEISESVEPMPQAILIALRGVGDRGVKFKCQTEVTVGFGHAGGDGVIGTAGATATKNGLRVLRQ